MKRRVARGCALLIPVIFVAALFAADSGLPDGKGKDAVENTCMECHTLERIRVQHLDEEGWNAVMREMMETGAADQSGRHESNGRLSDQEFRPRLKQEGQHQ